MQAGVRLEQTKGRLPPLVSVVDRQRRYVYASAAYQDWFGTPPAEIVGRSMQEVLGEEALAMVEAQIVAVLDGESRVVEQEMPYRAGKRTVRIHYVPQHGPGGAIVGFVALVQEIGALDTDAVPSNRLRDLEDLVENANVGMHWVDGDGRIIWANRSELQMLGYEAHEYIGRHVADFHADTTTAERFLDVLMGNGRLEREEAWLRHKDGSLVPVMVSSTARFDGSRFLHTRCVTTDISEIKRQEERRRRSEERLRRGQQQQAALVELGRRALEEPLEEVLGTAAATIARTLDHQKVAILQLVGEDLVLRGQYGWGNEVLGMQTPRSSAPQASYTLETLAPVTVRDVRTEDRFPIHPEVGSSGLLAGVTVPIGKGWGVLGTHTDRPITNGDDAAFVQGVANILASAIQRDAREKELIEATRRSTDRERQQDAVAQLGRRALVAPDLATVCQDVAATIASTLDHEMASVLRWLPERGVTEVLGQTGWGEASLGSIHACPPETQVGYTLGADGVVVVHDIRTDTRFRGHAALRQRGAVCGMSIVVPGAGRPWGVITTHAKRSQPYTMDQPQFLSSVANLLASAVRRFETEETIRRANKKLERLDALNRELTTLGQSMAAVLDVQPLTQMVTDHATRLANAEFGAFFFNKEDECGQSYMLYTLSGVDPDRFSHLPMPRKTAFFAPTFEGRETIRLDDVSQAEGFGKTPPYHGLPPGHLPVCSYLAVPVKSKHGEPVGGLFLGHSERARFGEAEQHAVEAIAGMAAVAMENARLYEESRKNERSALEASKRALEADQRKDEFLAMLGHELRNPLAPIQISLDLLERRGGPRLREHEIIRRQVRHVIQLVDDLMDVSRITRGKVQLDLAPVRLAEVIERALEMAHPVLEQKEQALRLEIDPHIFVEGDFARLAQVVTNLVTNAAKYTPTGGHIHLQCHEENGEAVFFVQDDGAGIEPDLLPRVFESFVQGNQASDRARGGLGLGLAIVQNLTQLHGGSVQAESEGAGKGSRFTVRLPTVPAQEPAVTWSEEPASDGQGRVLVVDDNPDVAETLRDIVSSLGYEARLALDGPSGLALAKEFQPDAVLLDIGLPIMDGYEVATELRRLHHDDMRLIAISGYGGVQDRERSQQAGIDVHLVKPVSAEQVHAALVQLIRA